MTMNRFFALAVLLFATACSLTDPRDVGNANRIALHANLEASASKAKRGSLTVGLPDAHSALDTYRIAATLPTGRDSYIDGARWNDFLTSVVQMSLRDNFSQSGVFSHVNDDTDVSDDRYQLNSEIRAFNAVYDTVGAAPKILVRMNFVLKRSNSGEVLKQFTVEDSEQATANSVTAIHEAFDAAFTKVSADALDKIVAATR